MQKVYVVTSGEYSGYCIEKVFLNKSKAEKYCKYHKNYYIEEYEPADDNIYTPMSYVKINYTFDIRTSECNIDCSIVNAYKEESMCYLEPLFWSLSYYEYITINYTHPINYPVKDEEKIKNKYIKVFQDLTSEIKYFLSDYDLSNEKEKERAFQDIKLFLNNKKETMI